MSTAYRFSILIDWITRVISRSDSNNKKNCKKKKKKSGRNKMYYHVNIILLVFGT